MPLSSRSATAYDRLALLTTQSDHAATLTFDWVKLRRSLRTLIDDLKLTAPLPAEAIERCEQMLKFADQEHSVIRDYAEKKASQCVTLNEQIQNGVFNDEAR